MTPHKSPLLLDPSWFFGLIVTKLEAVPMRLLVTMLCGVIATLSYWGTSSILERLARVEANQVQALKEDRQRWVEQRAYNSSQTACIAEIKQAIRDVHPNVRLSNGDR